MLDKLKNAWAKVEGFWSTAVGWIAAHPKTSFVVIVALIGARVLIK